MAYIQFPWRFLSLAILVASFLAGSLVQEPLFKKNKRLRIIIAFFLILLSIGFSIGYAKAPFYHRRADQHYLTRSNFTDGTNSPGNAFNTKWLTGIPEKRKDKIEFIEGLGTVKINEFKSTSYFFTVDSKENSKILINTAYFPGWVAIVNGKNVQIENYNGRMLLDIREGTNNVRAYLDNTPVQKISYVYFLLAVLGLTLYKKEKVPS